VKDKSRQKWQDSLGRFLEPGERVEAAVRGRRATFWQLMLGYGWVLLVLQKRYRAYVVTDRNVYVFQASGVAAYKVTKELEKRPLGAARVEYKRGYLTLDGMHESLVGFFGPLWRNASLAIQRALAAARRPASPAASPSAELEGKLAAR
jgi:hypothetical protein